MFCSLSSYLSLLLLWIQIAGMPAHAALRARCSAERGTGLTPRERIYLVPFSSAPTGSEGRPTHAAWRSSPWSTEFVWIDAGDSAPLRSRFQALYTRSALHFAFEFETLPAPRTPLNPDFPSACEIFLDPEARGRRYVEYAVAPDGSQHSRVWNGRLSWKTWSGVPGPPAHVWIRRLPGAGPGREMLRYEVAFPWRGMTELLGNRPRRPRRGAIWGANFSRVEAGTCAGDYVWVPAGYYYMHSPGALGRLVFAGERDGLQRVPTDLPPLPSRDGAEISGPFHRFHPVYWARFPLLPDGLGGYFAVTKNSVFALDRLGKQRFMRTRLDGLPQFLQSAAVARDRLYLTGTGLQAGVVWLDRAGRSGRIPSEQVPLVTASTKLYSLENGLILLAEGEQFQLISERPGLSGREQGAIVCVATLSAGRFALGTTRGLALYTAEGKLLSRTEIAGGVVAATRCGEAVVAASGANGLFRLRADGTCRYDPEPVRAHFDGVYTDSQGRVWAPYAGGLACVAAGAIRFWNEPLGIGGFRVFSAAPLPDGGMAFACGLPLGHAYVASRQSPFLLVWTGKRWRRYRFQEGVPGQINALTTIGDTLFLSTNAGIYRGSP